MDHILGQPIEDVAVYVVAIVLGWLLEDNEGDTAGDAATSVIDPSSSCNDDENSRFAFASAVEEIWRLVISHSLCVSIMLTPSSVLSLNAKSKCPALCVALSNKYNAVVSVPSVCHQEEIFRIAWLAARCQCSVCWFGF
jgi:hypothetical protein